MPCKALHALQATPPLHLKLLSATYPLTLCDTHTHTCPMWICQEYSCLQSLVYSVFSLPGLVFPKLAAWFPPSFSSDVLNVVLLEKLWLSIPHAMVTAISTIPIFSFPAFQGIPKPLQTKHPQLFVSLSLTQLQYKPHEGRNFVFYIVIPSIPRTVLGTEQMCNKDWLESSWVKPHYLCSCPFAPSEDWLFCVHSPRNSHFGKILKPEILPIQLLLKKRKRFVLWLWVKVI